MADLSAQAACCLTLTLTVQLRIVQVGAYTTSKHYINASQISDRRQVVVVVVVVVVLVVCGLKTPWVIQTSGALIRRIMGKDRGVVEYAPAE